VGLGRHRWTARPDVAGGVGGFGTPDLSGRETCAAMSVRWWMRVALHRSEQERHPAVVQHVGLREPCESQTALRANQGEQGRRV